MERTASGDVQSYRLTTTVPLRGRPKAGGEVTIAETADHPVVRTGDVMFDGLYALAVSEARQNSVSQISDGAYANGKPIKIDAFQTGESWRYVWTRDVSYSIDLAMAQFDPRRAVNSLDFKASLLKPTVAGDDRNQIIQDTGSGGSYPVSTDRVVWAMAATRTLDYLPPAERDAFLHRVFLTLCDTLEQDRRLAFDRPSGLYRGEHSFLDWREQTYPGWTRADVLPIAMSKALSTNALHYNLMRTAASYARQTGHADLSARYDGWADDLKAQINQSFFDLKAGLYSTYLLSDGVVDVRVNRYDLLGECLTILFGIADPDQAAAVIAHYPTGPFGPPVVWPQERSVPIYHNQAMWPFVTAYWARAAARAGNAAAVEAAVRSLRDQAALHLSNLENYDLVTGSDYVSNGPRKGPSIDSRRQLWSVAGYLSMVQDVVFGIDVTADGIRIRPCISTGMRDLLGTDDVIELRNFVYRGTRHRIRIHLPPAGTTAGIYRIDHVELNRTLTQDGYVTADSLRPDNIWDVDLKPPTAGAAAPLRRVDVTNERAIFSPRQPHWVGPGLQMLNGHAVLQYEQDAPSTPATYTIYRDGQPYAVGVTETQWTDPKPANDGDAVHTYSVGAVDPQSGNASHLSRFRTDRTPDQQLRVPASDLINRGGNLVGNDHFENWGSPDDQLTSRPLKVTHDGRYAIRLEFSNGAGPVNTGICCGVKRVEIRTADRDQLVAGGYVVMPQSGDWRRFDLSSPLPAGLRITQTYTVRIFDDGRCHNMSSLQGNDRYSGAGGGEQSFAKVNIAAIDLVWVGENVSAGVPDRTGGR